MARTAAKLSRKLVACCRAVVWPRGCYFGLTRLLQVCNHPCILPVYRLSHYYFLCFHLFHFILFPVSFSPSSSFSVFIHSASSFFFLLPHFLSLFSFILLRLVSSLLPPPVFHLFRLLFLFTLLLSCSSSSLCFQSFCPLLFALSSSSLSLSSIYYSSSVAKQTASFGPVGLLLSVLPFYPLYSSF